MSNQDKEQDFESDYNEQESEEPEMNLKMLQHLQRALAVMKKGQLTEGEDYDIADFKDKKTGKKIKKCVLNATGIKKLAFFFEISTEIVGPKEGTQINLPNNYGALPGEKTERFILAWLFVIRASFLWPKEGMKGTPSLRWAENVGSCSSNEDKTFGKSEKKQPHGRPVHDVIAIACTRAIGRAIVSLLGGGLTSAEITAQELQEQNQSSSGELRTTPSQLSAPQQNFNPLPTRETIKKTQTSTLRTS